MPTNFILFFLVVIIKFHTCHLTLHQLTLNRVNEIECIKVGRQDNISVWFDWSMCHLRFPDPLRFWFHTHKSNFQRGKTAILSSEFYLKKGLQTHKNQDRLQLKIYLLAPTSDTKLAASVKKVWVFAASLHFSSRPWRATLSPPLKIP